MNTRRKLMARDAHELRSLRAQSLERIDGARRAVVGLGISRNNGVLRSVPLEMARIDLRAAQILVCDLIERCGGVFKP